MSRVGHGPGTTPPLTDLTEANLGEWNVAALINGSNARVSGRVGRGSAVKEGETWIQGSSANGDRLILSYPRRGELTVDWDLSGIRFLSAWIAVAQNSNVKPGFPKIVLRSGNGSRTLTPAIAPSLSGAFQSFSVPLGGNSDWLTTSSGTFDLEHVSSFELDFEYTTPGDLFVAIDGVRKVPSSDPRD